MITKRDLLRSAALAALIVTTTTPVPANAQAKAEWPDIREAKAIAEEGFIYGLPIVMNYAVMYEFSVDTKNTEWIYRILISAWTKVSGNNQTMKVKQ